MKTTFRARLLAASLFVVPLATLAGAPAKSNPWSIAVSPDTPGLSQETVGDLTLPLFTNVVRLWDKAQSGLPYNAFTDLIRFRGDWFCVFREAEIHNGHDSGRLRLLRSADGKSWKSAAQFEWAGGDLRDPKLSITAEGLLMVNSSVTFVTRRPYIRQSVTFLSRDGEDWSSAYADSSGIDTWRWSVTWHQGVGYSMDQGSPGVLFTTRDGKSWEPLGTAIFPGGNGSETSIVFGADHTAYCLLRAGGPTPQAGQRMMGQFGVAKPPYKTWTWTDLGRPHIGGPKLIQLQDGRFLGSGRIVGRTILFWIDPEKGTLQEFLLLPSGGQGGTSYAGLVEHEGMVWISYYSGHESPIVPGRTYDHAPVAIYLAKVKLTPKGI